MTAAPPAVLAAYGLDGPARAVQSGLINQTFAVARAASPTQPVAIVQRLHPVFGPEVNLDLDAVSAHLAARGLVTPRLWRTVGGERWIEHDGGVWRAIDYVHGLTHQRIDSAATARAAGELVGRFHRAVDSLTHEYAFARAGVHDTEKHLAALRERSQRPGDHQDAIDADARALARDILAQADALPPMPALPLRHTHGDLKISNLLFDPDDPQRGLCLIDLDTLGRQTMAYELGDAMRSWCNPSGEDLTEVSVDETIFATAMAGHQVGSGGLLSAAERAGVVVGLETVCVELAARFTVDIFDDRYFGWDPARFSSRRAHNLVRARGQLQLARSTQAKRDALLVSVA